MCVFKIQVVYTLKNLKNAWLTSLTHSHTHTRPTSDTGEYTQTAIYMFTSVHAWMRERDMAECKSRHLISKAQRVFPLYNY